MSRVLTRPEAVAPTTRRKVLQAVEHLGYATNSAGKQLRTQRSGKLLVIVPDISNPFYSKVLQSIEEAAQREGYAVLLGDTQHDPKREERYTLMLRRREAEGLIVLGHGMPEAAVAVSEEMTQKAPIVSGCEFNPRVGIPSVHIDNQIAAQDAMQHLSYRWGIDGSGSSPVRWRAASVVTASRALRRARRPKMPSRSSSS